LTSAIALLTGAFAADLAVIWYAATHHSPLFAWENRLPLRVLPDMSAQADHVLLVVSARLLLGLLISFCLLALWNELRANPRAKNLPLIVGAALLAGIAICAPCLTSADAYSNVGYSILGGEAYTPPSAPFIGEFSVINNWWGTPLVPAPYGPLWIHLLPAQESFAHSLLGKLLLLRLAALIEFCCFLVALRVAGFKREIVALAALNPFFWLQFVVDAHNDILPLLLVTLAFALVRKIPGIAAALVIGAGLIKIPFALLGLLCFVRLRPSQRYGLGVLSILVTVGLSILWGGGRYFSALVHHAMPDSPLESPAHFLGAILAGGIVIATLVIGPRFRAALLAVPALAPGLFPWYLSWGLPYGLLRHRYLTWLLIALPVASVIVADTVVYRSLVIGGLTVLVLAEYLLFLIVRRRREDGRRLDPLVGGFSRPPES
jgi:hypothetical protein